MIKNSFLNKQMYKARKEKKVPIFLRRLVLLAVDNALKKHYPDTFPMKCLQSSLAINVILEELGIHSRAYLGALCVSQAFEKEGRIPNWNGFWGEDHHVWVCTEFGEFVDLTIHYLHLHPASSNTDQLQMPALWWEDTDRWPHIIQYLPDGVVKPQLPEHEMKDLESFKSIAISEFKEILSSMSVQDVKFSPILHGTLSMNELHAEGYPWLRNSLFLEEHNIPHPAWVQTRIAELTAQYANKT